MSSDNEHLKEMVMIGDNNQNLDKIEKIYISLQEKKEESYDIENDDYNLAVKAVNLLENDVIKSNHNYYYYEAPYWKMDVDKHDEICKLMRDTLRSYIEEKISKLKIEILNTKSDDKKEVLSKKMGKLWKGITNNKIQYINHLCN